MPLTLLEVGGGIFGLGIVAYIATRQSATGTGVVFSAPNPTSVAAITSANASDFGALQGAITSRAQIGAQLALGLAQLDTTNRQNALAASSADKSTAANLTTSLGAQKTSLQIAKAADASANYGVAMTASKDEKLATIAAQTTDYTANVTATAADYQADVAAKSADTIAATAGSASVQVAQTQGSASVQVARTQGSAAVQIGRAQATATIKVAQAQAQGQALVAASQASAQEATANSEAQAAASAASAQSSAAMWGGLSGIAGSVAKIVPFSSGAPAPSYMTEAANYGTLPGGYAAG